jgi:Response regulator containing CheY-like receiver, AAA-type ATPase, and DNA-binding domains
MTTLKERVSSNAEVNQSTQRILVVDDENSISELIATSLKFVGFDVRTAASGSAALKLPKSLNPMH